MKLGLFDLRPVPSDCQQTAGEALLPVAAAPLAEPVDTLALDPPLGDEAASRFADWVTGGEPIDRVAIASVNRAVEGDLLALVKAVPALAGVEAVVLRHDALPIEALVDEPARVGVDRLLGAVAANRLRRADRAAVVVDLGTAITVDLVSPQGEFLGGAILPGIGMASRALHERTDALPDCGLAELDASPDAVGKNTADAIHAGIFWGAVGAVRELIDRQSDRLVTPPQVFLTGGAAPSVARLLGGPERTVRYLPHLVLSGIAIAAGTREPE